MRANPDMPSQSSPEIASIHYHQQMKDPMFLSHCPRFPYPGYPNGVEPPLEQSGDVKIWQVVPFERASVRFIGESLG